MTIVQIQGYLLEPDMNEPTGLGCMVTELLAVRPLYGLDRVGGARWVGFCIPQRFMPPPYLERFKARTL